jgi:hypothetical protein
VTDAHAAAGSSGPRVARAFHRLLAATFLIAWGSLGVQIDVLIGSRGLLPVASYVTDATARASVAFWEFPTVFWWGASDAVLHAGIWAGLALAAAGLAGVAPRLCAALGTALYLSYVTASRTFLSFQWDNLLLECGALAIFLPRDRPAGWIHRLFRLLLFKLYWESGVAKWQSHLGDWQDGSAMTYYYETAPLPTALAWFAHQLPAWWHHAESWATLVLELVVPVGIFAPRRLRLLTAATLTAFQIVNSLTANYGFFAYLSVALHVFLLGERDVMRWWQEAAPAPRRASVHWLRRVGACAISAAYVSISASEAAVHFIGAPDWTQTIAPLRRLYTPWRLVNAYHLFGHITRERIEPEFQTFNGHAWTAHDLHYKPGAVHRAPPFVAPHQPRVDFQLWFYGLQFAQTTPAYVVRLVRQLCDDPAAVQPLFATPLPRHPRAVRIAFWRYHFTGARADDAWWTRAPVAETRPIPCAGGSR